SPKTDFVRSLLAEPPSDLEALTRRLEWLLALHDSPPERVENGDVRARERGAPCVHAGAYGTRSSQIVVVPDRGAPRIRFTAGPPCTSPWQDLPADLQFPSGH